MPAKTKKSSRSKVKKSSPTGLSGAFNRLSRPGKILTVLVILLIATLAGTYSYNRMYPNAAKAGAYATIYNSGGYRIAACQRSMNGVPSVSVLYAKPKSTSASASLLSFYSNKTIYSKASQTGWWNGELAHVEIPAPRNGWYDASIVYSAAGKTVRKGPGLVAMPFTPACPGFE